MAKISIIIPCKTVDDNVRRCLKYCCQLPEDKEIILVPDSVIPGLPAAKRNWGMLQATGDIFAFIDSDAYPSRGWLKNALYWLQCFDAVCGPGVIPPDATWGERIADQVHKWVFCPYRVIPQKPRIVPWHPTFNLIVKREVATEFENILTGEDDKFCLKIKDGIFYHPSILVYHNRRGIFKPLWKQFSIYAWRKGYFASIAFIAWLTTLWTYALNFVKGFLKKGL